MKNFFIALTITSSWAEFFSKKPINYMFRMPTMPAFLTHNTQSFNRLLANGSNHNSARSRDTTLQVTSSLFDLFCIALRKLLEEFNWA